MGDLDSWAQSASEKKVKSLAERCRGLNSVWNRYAGPRTEYKSRFTRLTMAVGKRINKDRNRSEVPIGSIYSIDPWELEASEIRKKDLIAGLADVAEEQEKMKQFENRPKKRLQLATYAPKNLTGSNEVKACFHTPRESQGGVSTAPCSLSEHLILEVAH